MTLRDRISDDVKTAMKARDQERLGTLRLIQAAIKDRDIAARVSDKSSGDDDGDIVALLAKMAKQREDSITAYESGGRPELAANEKAVLAVIQSYMPQQMSEAEVEAAVKAAIAETGASSIKDMGKVMGALKAKHAGKMDFGKAGARVKAALG